MNPFLRFHVRPIWVKYIILCIAFAIIYYILQILDRDSFSETLGAVDCAYFAIATQSTVGFGDIHPKKDAAKIIVALHIVISLLLVLFPLSEIHAHLKRS